MSNLKFSLRKLLAVAAIGAIIGAYLHAKSEDEANVRLEALTKLTKTLSTVEKYYVDDIKFK